MQHISRVRRFCTSLVIGVCALSSGLPNSLGAEVAEFLPAQEFSHVAGHIRTTGIFQARNGRCQTTLIIDTVSSDDPHLVRQRPARVKLSLRPFETFSIEATSSEALHITCGPMAQHLVVTAAAINLANNHRH